MWEVQIAESIKQVCPRLRLGQIQAKVRIFESPDSFWNKLEPLLQSKGSLTADQIRQLPVLVAARQAYRALGQDPSRYRLSAEALHRRFMKDQGIYHLSNLVDIVNIVSLQSAYSIGGYDTNKVNGAVTLRVGSAQDNYLTIGRGPLNITKLPVLVDQIGPFGNPSSDSARTCITSDTQHITLIFFDFGGQSELEETMQLTMRYLLEYAEARISGFGVQFT